MDIAYLPHLHPLADRQPDGGPGGADVYRVYVSKCRVTSCGAGVPPSDPGLRYTNALGCSDLLREIYLFLGLTFGPADGTELIVAHVAHWLSFVGPANCTDAIVAHVALWLSFVGRRRWWVFFLTFGCHPPPDPCFLHGVKTLPPTWEAG